MSIFNSINTSASALTAQRLRMDIVSSNIANAQSTRAVINENGEFEPYRRKMTVLETQDNRFKSMLANASGDIKHSGVRVAAIVEDEEPFKLVYNPVHPDANEAGYVEMPNVDPLQEMVDLMSSTRSYEANITALNASKGMLMKALEIGK
ncbi:flagellar basal body rod protein FlgC [Oceanobacillus profundus]|uniref:Flagellar basal-body rod protein FlgC n=1 Tax=Oceanobacillus profundus TaxID=372463 RepID=A0A417YK07_9BACI|nr:flagellar basal body rod protein FlgC [Oceanobacillus profundus]MBR3121585.1 flagellar basal body rod protein FlgC [Oceanobacillus sp.]PAE30027.1 flagellar basal body rod protein FlgC [Paenibacillus sp. 7884-2]MCM3396347.1 flagellar basal body rod protein FlgC [Oceanobacillus profundus]MDO6449643.1 flagellar basal body rod protein FlgC [Oceanobacillus profundus]RHW33645.1 flagellar basal body rod protein FlgC [Oceanobacillus profundus]